MLCSISMQVLRVLLLRHFRHYSTFDVFLQLQCNYLFAEETTYKVINHPSTNLRLCLASNHSTDMRSTYNIRRITHPSTYLHYFGQY